MVRAMVGVIRRAHLAPLEWHALRAELDRLAQMRVPCRLMVVLGLGLVVVFVHGDLRVPGALFHRSSSGGGVLAGVHGHVGRNGLGWDWRLLLLLGCKLGVCGPGMGREDLRRWARGCAQAAGVGGKQVLRRLWVASVVVLCGDVLVVVLYGAAGLHRGLLKSLMWGCAIGDMLRHHVLLVVRHGLCPLLLVVVRLV